MLTEAEKLAQCVTCEHCVKAAGPVWCRLSQKPFFIPREVKRASCLAGKWGEPAPQVQKSAFSPPQPARKAIPRQDWPIWAKAIALTASAADQGIGDTVARTIGQPASDAFKKWYRTIFGKDCGCTERQKTWNALYPYK